MGHLAAAMHACSTAGSTATTASGGGGLGLGLDLHLVGAILGAFALIGGITAAVTFVLARRMPPTEPAPIPVWNHPHRS